MQHLFIVERMWQMHSGNRQWSILESRLLIRKEGNLSRRKLMAGIRNIGRIAKSAGFQFNAETSFSCFKFWFRQLIVFTC
jgi:hypothetical protein